MSDGAGVTGDAMQVDAESWASCRGARVLVVDDDPDLRGVLSDLLEGVGLVACAASSGNDALGFLASRAVGEEVDLVLIDLRMPGPSGIEVIRELRTAKHLPPTILMTASAEPTVRSEALTLGIHVLEKPFTFDAFRRVAALLILSTRAELRRDSEGADRAVNVVDPSESRTEGRLPSFPPKA